MAVVYTHTEDFANVKVKPPIEDDGYVCFITASIRNQGHDTAIEIKLRSDEVQKLIDELSTRLYDYNRKRDNE